jgi:hypothetical protein
MVVAEEKRWMWDAERGRTYIEAEVWRGQSVQDPFYGQTLTGVVVKDANGLFHAGVEHGLLPFAEEAEMGGKTFYEPTAFRTKKEAIPVAETKLTETVRDSQQHREKYEKQSKELGRAREAQKTWREREGQPNADGRKSGKEKDGNDIPW